MQGLTLTLIVINKHFKIQNQLLFIPVITEGIRAMNLTGSSNLDTVVDTYYLALFARYPKAIYRPGWDVYMYQSLEYVPSWMTDRFTILLGMKPAQLP